MGTDAEYYRKRLDEEYRRADAETDPDVRYVHETLAKMHHVRLDAEELDISRLRPEPLSPRRNQGHARVPLVDQLDFASNTGSDSRSTPISAFPCK